MGFPVLGKVVSLQQPPVGSLASTRIWPRRILAGVIAKVTEAYQRLKMRYGPRYTKTMVGTVFVALFLPIPGSTLIAVACIMLVAEVHRAVSKSIGSRPPEAVLPNEWRPVMSMKCNVIMHWSATPAQLTSIGEALWRWCIRAAGESSIYEYLDNQGLADLIAGKFPASSMDQRPRVQLCVRDESPGRRETIAQLRRDMPTEGLDDIQIDGKSWTLVDCR